MKISTCDFCIGHGYIEVCEGIGPKVSCPKCVDKYRERLPYPGCTTELGKPKPPRDTVLDSRVGPFTFHKDTPDND